MNADKQSSESTPTPSHQSHHSARYSSRSHSSMLDELRDLLGIDDWFEVLVCIVLAIVIVFILAKLGLLPDTSDPAIYVG